MDFGGQKDLPKDEVLSMGNIDNFIGKVLPVPSNLVFFVFNWKIAELYNTATSTIIRIAGPWRCWQAVFYF